MKRFHKSYIAALLTLAFIIIVLAVASSNAQAVKSPTFTLLAKTDSIGGTLMAYRLEAEGKVFVSIVFVGDGWGDMNTVEVGK